MILSLPTTFWFFSHLGLAFAAVFLQPGNLPRSEYDFIIVGGGTAGATLANCLTENPKVNVLVIEAGRSNTAGQDVDIIQIPWFGTGIGGSFDWNFTTVPMPALDSRTMPYGRGFVLGGSSSINYMFYTRGSSDDFDFIANFTDDDGWSWESVFPYFVELESFSSPADTLMDGIRFNASLHGTSGPLLISLPSNASNIDSRVLATTSELAEFPFNLDMNSGNPLGIGWLQSTIGFGERSSSATAFLTNKTLSRDNLDVLIHTRVTKLVQTAKQSHTPVVLGLEVAQAATSLPTFLRAKKEIILSAGSIGTPQILMLSGIGDEKELRALDIPLLMHMPDVGKNLQDHPFVPLQWAVNDTSLDDVFRDPRMVEALFEQYNTSKTGEIANNPGGNHVGWFRLPDNSSVLRQVGDPTTGPLSPHFEFAIVDEWLSVTEPLPPTGSFMSVCAVLVSPTSRGSVTLASTSAFDAPLIDPGFFQTESDMLILTEAVKAAKRFTSGLAWHDYIVAPFGTSANTMSDEAIAEYIRQQAGTFRHPVGTARMAQSDESGGVVGADLLVKNVRGLRIVDGSVFPRIFGAHMQAPIYAIAQRAADLVKIAHNLM